VRDASRKHDKSKDHILPEDCSVAELGRAIKDMFQYIISSKPAV